MSASTNIFDYLCLVAEASDIHSPNLLRDVSDEELFQTMDEIIDQKYPDCHEYDVESDGDTPPAKKSRTEKSDDSVSIENLEKIVKKMHGCKPQITPFTTPDDITIHEKIDRIFNQMKKTVK